MPTPPSQLVENLLKEILGARKALKIYPPGNPLVVQWLQRLHQTVESGQREGLPPRLRVSQSGFEWDGGQLPTRVGMLEAFRFELASRQITEIAIAPGVETWELQQLLELLNGTPPATDGEPAGPDRPRMAHILLGGSLSRYSQAEGVASSAEVLDALDGAVAEVLDEVGGLFRDLAYDRLRLAAWLADLSEAGAGPAVVFQAVQMLIGLVDVEPDREIRYRTLIESFMSLPGPVQGAVLADHLVPAVRADLGLLRLLTRFSADELAELVALVPAAVLEALQVEIQALPTEEWKKSRLSESLEEALAEKEVAATPLEPLIADDDPELSRLREMILAACPPAHVLGHSTRVLFHLFGETESEAYPSFLVDSLEEAIGEALEGDQLPLALRILQWLGQPEWCRPEWGPEHQRRLKLVSQRLAERSRVSRLVEHLRRRDDPPSIAAVAEYLQMSAAQAIDEFVDRFAGEPPGEVRSRLLECLAILGPAAAPAVRARANDPRWMVAQSAIALLTRIGDGDSVPAIAKAIGHPHPQVRAEAARALVALVPRQAPRRLLECLDDPDADVRRAALGGLRTLAEAGSVTPIRDYLASPTRTVAALLVKRDLIAGLASVARPEARQCLELIARRRVWLWQGTERKVRALARQALLGAPESRPPTPPGPRAGHGGPGPESP